MEKQLCTDKITSIQKYRLKLQENQTNQLQYNIIEVPMVEQKK
jgi:hypothetical protein